MNRETQPHALEASHTSLTQILSNSHPDHPAIVIAGEGLTTTYAQLLQQVNSVAQELRNLGVNRRDRIGIALPNGLEMIVAFLAATSVATAAPLNPAYKRDEFKFYLEDTSAKLLIVPPAGAEEAKEAAECELIHIGLNRDGQVSLDSAAVSSTQRASDPNRDDIALVLHTSGTTSRPKRVPLAHRNLLASTYTVAETYKLTSEDVSLCVMPLFHVHGLVASTLATLATGGTVVIVPRFNPLSFWKTVRDHRITWFSAVPTIHQLLLSRTKGAARLAGAEQLRFIRSCSAPLAASLMSELEARFGVPVIEAYGMTEAAHQMASNPLPPGQRKPGSVGQETGPKIAILDENGGEVRGHGRGEVAIKGPNVFAGYESNPEANAAAFTNGWFRTGDEGYLDSDGYLVLAGRIKELINRGGEKISPHEIDEVLLSHPSVTQAVSFGVADKYYGEEVEAAVVIDKPVDEASLVAHCQSLLADFKVPKTIHFVQEIPRTATGKIQRRNVAAEIARLKS
ncbi:MAG TPA: acyl--CoA ligase [Pyrinomonadaceae bacterium]|nr:acyl--CoA ligase [Pyrinomonadaceae bacterium]